MIGEDLRNCLSNLNFNFSEVGSSFENHLFGEFGPWGGVVWFAVAVKDRQNVDVSWKIKRVE